MILSLFIYSVQNRLKRICKSFNFLFILQSIQLYWNVSFYILVHESGNGNAMDLNNILVCSLLTVWREQKKHILIYQYFVAGQHLSGDWIFGPSGRDWSIVIVLDCLVPVSLLCIVLCWPFVWQDQERKGTREYRSRKEGWREWKWLMFDWLVDLIDLNLLYQQNEHTKKKIFKKDNKLQNSAPFFTVVWPRIRDEIFYFKIKIHKVSLIFKNNKIYIVSIGINCFEILSWYPVQP